MGSRSRWSVELVECNVKVVHNFQVGLYGYVEAVILKMFGDVFTYSVRL